MLLDCCVECNHLIVYPEREPEEYCNKEQCDVLYTKCMSHHAVKVYLESHKLDKLRETGGLPLVY